MEQAPALSRCKHMLVSTWLADLGLRTYSFLVLQKSLSAISFPFSLLMAKGCDMASLWPTVDN